jgi:gliding motility-associated-like protein
MKNGCRFLHLWILLLLSSHAMWASHIFGGNMYLTQVDKDIGKFKLTMNIYVDGNTLIPLELANLQNTSQSLRVFSKTGNKKMMDISLPFARMTDFVYDNETCSKLRSMKTIQFTYELEVTLNPNAYSDINGYYIAWERCCRNASINNIVNPVNTGLTLYLEFPSLVENGIPIVYSSPEFNLPNGDYICVNKSFKMDFGVKNNNTDIDLKYSIVTPLGSHNDLANYDRVAQSGPYPTIQWIAGYSSAASISGVKPLSINSATGEVTVTANTIGLFAFTVQCEQFKNGIRIGSVRHDFQLPVVDCSQMYPPVSQITYNNQVLTEVEMCKSESVKLEIDISGGGSYNYQWKKDGVNIVGAISPTYWATDFGNYTVVKSYKSLCASDTSSQSVKVKEAVLVNLKPSDKGLCLGDSILLSALAKRADVVLTWSKDKKELSHKDFLYVKEVGVYYVKGSVPSLGCVTSDSVQIQKKDSPTIQIISHIYNLSLGDSQRLFCKSDNPQTTFIWSPNKWLDDETLDSPTSMPETSIMYKVLALTPSMCPYKDSIYINVDVRLHIPTAFSPNNDGVNDVWDIYGIQKFPNAAVSIFNRWGELIFHSIGYNYPWDGRINDNLAPTGNYTYEIRNASVYSNKVYSGSIYVAY